MKLTSGLTAFALLFAAVMLAAAAGGAAQAPDPDPTLEGLTGTPDTAAAPADAPAARPGSEGAHVSAVVVLLQDTVLGPDEAEQLAPAASAAPSGPLAKLGVELLDLFRGITVFVGADAPSAGRLVSTSTAPSGADETGRAGAVAGAATAIGVLSLLGAWLRRTGWLGAALPMFSRIEGSALLKHPVRAQIVEFVRANPGANVSEIARELDLAWGTATHHLDKLARDQIVAVRRLGNQRCFFEAGRVDRREMDARSALKGDVAQRIAAHLRGRADVPQKELGEELGLSRAATSFHVRKMVDRGVIVRRRDGRSVRLTLTETAEEAIRATEPDQVYGPALATGGMSLPTSAVPS